MGEIEKPSELSRSRSVDSLQRLYTTVISLSVASILIAFIENISEAGIDTVLIQSSMLVAFFVTIVPFYHGANRYLDATYVTKERDANEYALMIDFIVLFVEGILFFTLSRLTNSGDLFFTVFLILLILDIIWILITRTTANSITDDSEEFRKWAIINITCIILLVAVFFTNWLSDIKNGSGKIVIEANTFKFIVAMVVVTGRTVFDYVVVWDFYYPKIHKQAPLDLHSRHEGNTQNPVVKEIKEEQKKEGKKVAKNRKEQQENSTIREPTQ